MLRLAPPSAFSNQSLLQEVCFQHVQYIQCTSFPIHKTQVTLIYFTHLRTSCKELRLLVFVAGRIPIYFKHFPTSWAHPLLPSDGTKQIWLEWEVAFDVLKLNVSSVGQIWSNNRTRSVVLQCCACMQAVTDSRLMLVDSQVFALDISGILGSTFFIRNLTGCLKGLGPPPQFTTKKI